MDEQSLNELLECSVCLERLDHTSKVLPCQHTFCRRCLDEIVSTKRELRCPECRTIVEVRVEDLPSNILLIRLLEGLKTKNSERARPSERRNEHLSLSVVQQMRQQGMVRLSQPCAKALFNYEARDHGDLSFKKGDVIILRKQVDENWYHGECNGQHGFFPASYAQVIIPLPVTTPQCKALYDFDFEKESEKKDCLCFKKDDLITVIKRVDNNWVEGRKGEKIGIFPISFVEMNEAAKTLISSKSSPALHAGVGTRGKGEGAGPARPSQELLNPAGLAGDPSHQKRHSYTGSSQPQNSTAIKQHNRRSLDLNSKANLEILQVAPTNSDRVRSPPPVPKHNTERTGAVPGASHSSRQDGDLSAESSPTISSRLVQSMVAMFNYKPQKEDELELKKGDYYSVSETCLDGWYRGKCLKTGKVGVFPGNYVQAVRSPSAFRAVSGNIQNIRAKLPPSLSSQPGHSGNVSGVPVSLPSGTDSDHHRSSKSSSPVRPRSSSSRPNGSPSRASSSPSRSSSSPHRSSHVPPTAASRSSKTASSSSSSSLSVTLSSKSATVSSSSSHVKVTSGDGHIRSHDRQPHIGATTYLSSSSSSRTNQSQASSMSATQHSMSTSVNTTPPNVVLGATAEKTVIPSTKDKEKKDKKEKEKISLVKRLTSGKSKKSKSPAADAEAASSSSDGGVMHFRSGSFPTAVISAPEGQHAKSSSFDSSASTQPPVKPSKSKQSVREKFRCKEPYPPQSEIELELKVGDIVYVHKKRDDGWFKGTLQRTGKSGLFPGSFVEKVD